AHDWSDPNNSENEALLNGLSGYAGSRSLGQNRLNQVIAMDNLMAANGISVTGVGKAVDLGGAPSEKAAIAVNFVNGAAAAQIPYRNDCGDCRFGPNAYDCSGLMVTAYKSAGITLRSTVSQGQYYQG